MKTIIPAITLTCALIIITDLFHFTLHSIAQNLTWKQELILLAIGGIAFVFITVKILPKRKI